MSNLKHATYDPALLRISTGPLPLPPEFRLSRDENEDMHPANASILVAIPDISPGETGGLGYFLNFSGIRH